MTFPAFLFLAIGACSLPLASFSQNIGINTDGAAPHPSAMLDIDVSAISGTKRGLLIPRMTTVQRNAIPTPATGLLVFDITTNGFWYFNGALWTTLWSNGNGWALQGNTGTTPAMDFVGTTDNVPLHFRVNNVTAGRIVPADSVVAFGSRAGEALTTGRFNTFVGQLAGRSTTTGSRNTFVGNEAGASNTGDMNTFIGHRSGAANTTGSGNTFLGHWSGQYTTSGSSNVFLGRETGRMNTTALANTFVGAYAGQQNITGNTNTFLGFVAGRDNTTGSLNTMIGGFSGWSNTTGNSNTMLGNQSGQANTTGEDNTFVGTSAGAANTTASGNVLMGRNAGLSNTIGQQNTAIGWNAGATVTTAGFNTFLGSHAGWNATGANNTYLGHGAGANATTGQNNSTMGQHAGAGLTTGSDNVMVGRESGFSITTGSRNTFVGAGAGRNAAALTNSAAIGYNAQVTTGNSLVLGGTGADAVQVGIGVTAPTAELEVNGYTKLGSDAPAIKVKKLTGTSAATQGGEVLIPHGVVPSRILAVDVLIEATAGTYWVPAGHDDSQVHFLWGIQNTNIRVMNIIGESSFLLSRPLKILVTYEE
jgi:hypothetical protein